MDRIKIHNFGPVKDVDIELSKLMVFIGPQGSGKSTIAKVLTIFSDVFWWITICDAKDPMLEFKKMGIAKYFNADTRIDYYGRYDVHIVYSEGKFSISVEDFSEKDTIDFCKYLIGTSTKERLEELGYNIDNLSKDMPKETHRRFLRANLRFACYVPAERNIAGIISSSLANIILSKTPLPNILMEYLSLFERAKNHYSTYDAPFLGIHYDKDKGKDCISVLENEEKYLPLEECSSGIQSALPMLMVTDYAAEDKCFDTFVVEEPEQNLFPINQRGILNRLIALTQRNDCRSVVINTHSPYLLSALNVSMLAAKISNMNGNDGTIDEIVPPQFQINNTDVSVSSLGDDVYCKSIIDEKTGLISVNYLDVVSEAISSDFNRLYQIYLNCFRNGN